MNIQTEHIREDRVTFRFDEGERPEIQAGWGPSYPARITRVYARFTPEGDVLSVKLYGSKVKKDGELSQVSAYIPWNYEHENGWYEKVKELRAGRG